MIRRCTLSTERDTPSRWFGTGCLPVSMRLWIPEGTAWTQLSLGLAQLLSNPWMVTSITPRGAGVNIETLFLESARTEEWSALSQTGDGIHIAFGTDTILVPPIIET